jgi:hypothetical protein
MVRRLFLFLVMAGFALQGLAQNPPLSAFVDRTEISINDVLTLTLRIDAKLGSSNPSLAGLNRESFEQVGGTSTRSTYTNNNGNIQSWTEYSISLRPLKTGVLTIPAFRVNGEVSNPITITVGDAAETTSSAESEEIFIESTVSKDTIYVQEQLLYTIKIFYAIGFDQGAQLTSPQVTDAVVQQLGSDDNYQEVVNGIGYNVTERRFVIFPQSSGELTIPPVYFSASVGRRGGINRFFSNRANVREIDLMTDTHVVKVNPAPDSFDGQTWLPAAALTLTETWSDALDTVEVGAAVTRNIVLTATGLSSSLLPGVEYGDLNGLKYYPDQPAREDVADKNGIVGKRSEGTAIVASQPGEFVLPEVQLPWWNTTTDSMEIATLPARTITVVPAAGSTSSTANGTPDFVAISGQQALPDTGANTDGDDAGTSVLWMSTTALFAAAWLFSTMMWLRSRQQVAYAETVGNAQAKVTLMPEPGKAVSTEKLADPETCLKVLKIACDNSHLADIRKALLRWGQGSFRTANILTLDTLAHYCQNESLTALCRELDIALYGSTTPNTAFNCKALYAEVAGLHKNGVMQNQGEGKYSLPPLYKNK